MSQKNPNQSPLDDHREYIEELAAAGEPKSQIAKLLYLTRGVETTRDSVRRAFDRWDITNEGPTSETPGVQIEGDRAAVITKPSAELGDSEKIVRDRGFDPKEWEFKSVTVNEWDSPTGETLRQLKVHLTRKRPESLLHPAVVEGKKITVPTKAPKPGDEGELVVFTGDQQAPYHDQALHGKFLSWLRKNKPAKGVLLGDTVDFPDISRHRTNPERNATPQQCVNAGHAILRDYAEASPKTEWVKLCGNHDERIRNTLIDQIAELYGLKRAEVEGQVEPSVLSMAHLLRLDELGIRFLEPEGSYEHVQVNVSPYLAARHGWVAVKGAGSSALKTLEHLGFSVIVGHTHRQGLVHKTTHDINGNPTTLAAVETGCMCRIDEGLGYTVAPNWQQGFATARVWPDGKFKLDLATHVNDILLWRDQRYE